jgi:hypothetical protein
MDDETRAYFEEMRRDLSGLRGEVAEFRGDVDRRFEALRRDLQTVIEGVDTNGKKITAHTRSIEVLRDQMNTRFARVRVDLSVIQRHVAGPRARRRPRR